MNPLRFTKQSWEQKQLDFTVTPALATGDVVLSVKAFMVDADGNDVSDDMIEGAPSYVDEEGKVYVLIKGGTSGKVYTLAIYVTTQNIPEKIKDQIKITIDDKVVDVEGVL